MVNKKNSKIKRVMLCIFVVLVILLIAQEVVRVRIPEEYMIKQAVYCEDSASSHTSYYSHVNYNIEVKGAEYRALSELENKLFRDSVKALRMRSFDFTSIIDTRFGNYYQVYIETPKRDYRFDFHEGSDCVALYISSLDIKIVFGNANQFIDFIQKL